MGFKSTAVEQKSNAKEPNKYYEVCLQQFMALPTDQSKIVAKFYFVTTDEHGNSTVSDSTVDAYVTAYQSVEFNMTVVNDLLEALGKPVVNAGEEVVLPEPSEMDESWQKKIEVFLIQKKGTTFLMIPSRRVNNQPIFRQAGGQESSVDAELNKLLGK
jgi:hypothetical protein